MTKTSNALADILGRIRDKEAAAAREREELAELHRAAEWARGQERRARLAELRADAEAHLGDASEAGAIAAAAREVADATVRLHRLCAARNDRLAELNARATRERVTSGAGMIPPSPADGGVATVAGGIVVGRRAARPADADRLVRTALDAADQHVRKGADLPDFAADVAQLETEVPPLDDQGTYYWRHTGHGGLFTSVEPDKFAGHEGMARISLREYLEAHWGVTLDDLPEDVRAVAEEAMPA